MCAIAGYYSPCKRRLDLASYSLNTVNLPSVFSHRGPDSHGIWNSEKGNLFFFHARLAIQDLSSLGHQPMVSQNGAFCISFNGEIYNFRHLSRQLSSAGIQLKGHSDTEVLLEYIAYFGLDQALEDIVGMFAFSLYDRKAEKLYLVRDRIGEKPLYWYFDGEIFAFASEIKGLKAMLGNIGEIDKISLGQYFRYGYVPEPRSIYAQIKKVIPGAMLEIPVDSGANYHEMSVDEFQSTYSKIYWSLWGVKQCSQETPFKTREEAVSNIHRLLKETIANQSIADVDLGVYLSGGIDSTLVTAILQSLNEQPIKSFTVGFQNPSFNEANFARELASHIGTEHYEITVTEADLLGMIYLLPGIYDEPIANASQIPVLLLSKYASEHVRVCLSGDGGDELFGGYNRYLWGKKIAGFNQKYSSLLSDQILNILPPLIKTSSLIRFLIPLFFHGPIQNLNGKLSKLFSALKIKSDAQLYDFLLSTWFSNNPAGTDYSQFVLSLSEFDDNMFIDAAMLCDQLHYLPGDNLTKVDRASMAYSLEVRLPLLSHELLQDSWKITLKDKLENGKSKSILREILYKYVPKNLIERPKMGFSVPIGEWLKGPLREWAEGLLAARAFRDAEHLDVKLIDTIWKDHINGKADSAEKLWSVLVFLQWHTEVKL
ncbi:MAG: asparagine synthase (glutamine-hydrolyzing) [Candidatus Competibacteraceae bacterium]